MAFDASVGVFLTGESATAEAALSSVNEQLCLVGLAPHKEPRSWDEVFASHPTKRRKPRDLGRRLGFYSDRKYMDLCGLMDFLEVRRASPGVWPLSQDVSLIEPPTLFLHTRAMLSIETVLLPRTLELPLECQRNRHVSRIASAPRLKEECSVVLAACGGFDSDDPSKEWKSQKYEPLLHAWNIAKAPIHDVWHVAGDVMDLCARLIQVANDVIWSGCFAITN